MGIEAGALKNDDDKAKQKAAAKKKASQNSKNKEKITKDKEIRENIKADEALNHMRELINDNDLELSIDQVQLIEKVITNNDISTDDIEEILEKIDEIEKTEDIDKYLPKEYRITGEEYKKALKDDIFRVQMITKIDTALTILANQANGDTSMGLNLFSGYMAMLDKKLIKIQENQIDVKDSLKEIDRKKGINKTNDLSFWEKFINYIKNI